MVLGRKNPRQTEEELLQEEASLNREVGGCHLESFTEKVLKLRPKQWCDVAQKVTGKGILSRGTGMSKGAEAGRRSSSKSFGY